MKCNTCLRLSFTYKFVAPGGSVVAANLLVFFGSLSIKTMHHMRSRLVMYKKISDSQESADFWS
jgi:hypothetical protein